MEENKDTKTVINIGWDKIGSIIGRFSAFAEKGYILSEMNDKFFVFLKNEPQHLEFLLYNGSTEDKEFLRLTEKGYRLICSCGKYHMLTIAAENAAVLRAAALRKKYILTMAVSSVLLAAVILGIPNEGGFPAFLRSALTAVLSCVFVFSAVKLFRKEENTDGDGKDTKE